MKWCLPILVLLFITSSCENEQRNKDLNAREAALNQKEQELLLKEKTLQLREEELGKKQQYIDSTASVDSSRIVAPALQGNWIVEMTCTETSCTGSAVGDKRTEEWNLLYQGQALVVKASAAGQLVRTYTGFYTGNTIELLGNVDTAAARMVVRLRQTDETHLEGQREITRPDCKVIYDLKLKKNED